MAGRLLMTPDAVGNSGHAGFPGSEATARSRVLVPSSASACDTSQGSSSSTVAPSAALNRTGEPSGVNTSKRPLDSSTAMATNLTAR